ncbi:unnamed protein product [Didymodactylos carnosus]|uniref:Uncharacterized protein n=1 Tax=Didymodactylos carnosus TaxID=1234261 RepID=A0A815FZH1_9BILA|nr:unnamed protein product [Didymodactylos carnosus]CAF1331939.1 unnamed protein product [Didymodactylos carnosus]CAF3906461.1 unnamed protein product [Didymodactylos carnosus]CAF4186060.1 unnamed protein product [Didymodactylos carnosus]
MCNLHILRTPCLMAIISKLSSFLLVSPGKLHLMIFSCFFISTLTFTYLYSSGPYLFGKKINFDAESNVENDDYLDDNMTDIYLDRKSITGLGDTSMKNNHSQMNIHHASKKLLKVYQEQLEQYTRALFVPEIRDQHVVLRVRLKQFAKYLQRENHTNPKPSSEIINLTLNCYELSNDIKTTSQQPFFQISLLLNISLHFSVLIKSFTSVPPLSSPFYSITKIPLNQPNQNKIFIHIPRLFSETKSYRFTFQTTDQPNKTNVIWPKWPLSPSCAKRYVDYFIQNPKQSQVPYLSCSVMTRLIPSDSTNEFSAEQKSISHWLNVQYQSSTINFTQPRRLHPFETSANICTPEFHQWIQSK